MATPPPFSYQRFLRGDLVQWKHPIRGSDLRVVASVNLGPITTKASLLVCATCKAEYMQEFRVVYLQWVESGEPEHVHGMCAACWEYLERETRDK